MADEVRYMFCRDVITENQVWKAPGAKDQKFEVKLWGGGGAGSCSSFDNVVSGAGGGSGYMNCKTFEIPENEEVSVTIGKGGIGCSGVTATDFVNGYIGESGGTTMFGRYMSAAGGCGGKLSEGGQGGFNGGAPGKAGEGNFGSYGCVDTVGGVSYASGGGGSAIQARGRGGCANYVVGDGGTAAGGAGCFVVEVDNAGVHRRTGNGGQGVAVISYYRRLG